MLMPLDEKYYAPGPRPIRLSASEFVQVRAMVTRAGIRLDDFFQIRLEFANVEEKEASPVRVLLTPRA
jgi:hypothetical protein